MNVSNLIRYSSTQEESNEAYTKVCYILEWFQLLRHKRREIRVYNIYECRTICQLPQYQGRIALAQIPRARHLELDKCGILFCITAIASVCIAAQFLLCYFVSYMRDDVMILCTFEMRLH